MKRKKSKAIFMALLTAVLLVATPIVASAAHTNPRTGEQCNQSLYYSHDGGAGSYHVSQHMLSDGRYCTITCVGHYHTVRCSGCGYYMSGVIIGCEEHHSLCGGTKIEHP